MSCSFAALVALHVEGDLDESERQRVESHLRTCPDCWDLAEDLRESQAIFKSIRQDVPNQAMLSAVRARVLEDVAGIESGGWFSTTGADPSVLLRLKEDYDGAEPSAGALASLNLLALTHLMPDVERFVRAKVTGQPGRRRCKIQQNQEAAPRADPHACLGQEHHNRRTL